MERVAGDVDCGEFGIGDFNAPGIFTFVQLGAHSESGCGCRCRDQLNNGFEASQGLSAPIERDERKEAVFDFVPFTGAWRQMADGDGNSQRVGQGLQFYFP